MNTDKYGSDSFLCVYRVYLRFISGQVIWRRWLRPLEIIDRLPYALVAPFRCYLRIKLLSLTRKTDYALVALAGLVAESPAGASAHELAERFHLPLPALRNILKRLTQHGVVRSTQGASGGYRLARPADEITLAQVVNAVQGPVRLALCCAPDREPGEGGHVCRLENSCRIKATVRLVHQRLMDFLGEVNLAQIASGEIPAGAGFPVTRNQNAFAERQPTLVGSPS